MKPNDREAILARVNAALAPLPERARLPEFDTEIAVLRQVLANRDPLAVFAERLQRVNGLAVTDVPALVARLRADVEARR